MTFFLDKNASREELTDAVNYLLANFIESKNININSGEITAQTTGISGYLYRYLSIKYADSWDGQVNFSNSPTNRLYYGVYNSDAIIEPTDFTKYLWTKVVGGFGTTKFVWYQVTGGRQIQILVDTARPFANYFPDAGLAIDLDLLTVASVDDLTLITDNIGLVNNLIDEFKFAPKSPDTVVGLSLPAELTTSSPVVNVGTLSATWASQTANKVFASPNGAPGTPSFRALVSADIPNLTVTVTAINYSILTGDNIIKVTAGGTTQTLLTAVGNTGKVFTVNNASTGICTVACTGGQTINTVATQIVPPGSSMTVYSDNANWQII